MISDCWFEGWEKWDVGVRLPRWQGLGEEQGLGEGWGRGGQSLVVGLLHVRGVLEQLEMLVSHLLNV